MPPPTPAALSLDGERFRRKHLSFILGDIDGMTAFKAAVGSTPGRVHPNVVRATPFFANRGPSRRIGTVINTYALTLRAVNDTENRELEKLFFDENAILLPLRLACCACTEARVKCFARREGAGYVCAATKKAFQDDKTVLQWVAHWRESAPYDSCGSEAEWLADLDEVITVMRINAPSQTDRQQTERRWPANTNADQLVRAGVVGETDLRHDATAPQQDGEDSEPPRKRRHVSPDGLEHRDIRPAPRRSNEGPSFRSVSGPSHHRSVSTTSREHESLPSPATTSRSANSPLDPEHRNPHISITDAHHLHHPSMHPGPRSRSTSYSVPSSHSRPPYPSQLHPNAQPHFYPQPHPQHSQHSQQPQNSQQGQQRTVSASSSRLRANSHQPSALPLAHPHSSQRVSAGPRSASYSQPSTPKVPHQPQDDEMVGRAKEYFYTLQGYLDTALALIRADEAALAAVGGGLDQLDRRKAELQEEQKRLKIDIRDRTNEVRRMREEMLALRNDTRVWPNEEGKGRGNGV
ncbi:hypothetical protein CC85DRAFT_311485 [Cutaneotrichosporon oleaginosum]|uniref:Uncharacterized protein n=1 Tax=Cutaneotrichosporon oleaginosum TaxID=879819 RepID=A0A0J0XS10_9TREE|nr:uncharacterized protein CC85DRAFT_311485 [Cutaneotrichosporon oleaginosum]KLT43877.1 hypothetical protein CC85DRAFT_311485 [Cutaneotrichosporon oleaginosum]TXT06383.1 hypothetical protein COLE_05714 [Cutaneotrichosporon oleaginosum]